MHEIPPAATDSDLLHRYAREQDEGAFAQLVSRHQAMVMGVATRRTGDAELARDVTQQVFVLLARKAAQLLRHDRVTGWLYQTASYEAAKVYQSELRRRSRQARLAEQAPVRGSSDEQWQTLEEAMAALAPADREALVMHYFQDHSYAEMAAAATLSEAAMRKRVSRALDHLGRQLQRRGLPVPAVALLTSAAALQSAAPAQAALAASVLAASGSVHAASWIPWAAFMTTNTALKTTAAVAILAAAPLVWQTRENAGLRAEMHGVRESRQTSMPAGAPLETGVAAAASESEDLSAARARLESLRGERSVVEARLRALQAQAAKLRDEVVVSLGRVDEVALKVAELQLMVLEMERQEGTPEEREKLVEKVMALTAEMMPVMAEYRTIGADPKLSARMAATTTAKVAGVSDAVRIEMERRLLTHYERMKRTGLTLDQRPAQNRQDWDRRYGEASAAAMRDIENLLPAAYRDTPVWKSQISTQAEGNLNFLDAAFGEPAPNPTGKTAP